MSFKKKLATFIFIKYFIRKKQSWIGHVACICDIYIYIFIYIYNIYMYINSYSACKNCSDFQNPITKSTPVTRVVCWFGLGLSGLKHDLHLSGLRVVWLRAAALVHQPLLIGMDPSKRRSTSRLPNLHFSFLSLPRWEAGAKSFHQPAVHD